jgi:hypothetical protein
MFNDTTNLVTPTSQTTDSVAASLSLARTPENQNHEPVTINEVNAMTAHKLLPIDISKLKIKVLYGLFVKLVKIPQNTPDKSPEQLLEEKLKIVENVQEISRVADNHVQLIEHKRNYKKTSNPISKFTCEKVPVIFPSDEQPQEDKSQPDVDIVEFNSNHIILDNSLGLMENQSVFEPKRKPLSLQYPHLL